MVVGTGTDHRRRGKGSLSGVLVRDPTYVCRSGVCGRCRSGQPEHVCMAPDGTLASCRRTQCRTVVVEKDGALPPSICLRRAAQPPNSMDPSPPRISTLRPRSERACMLGCLGRSLPRNELPLLQMPPESRRRPCQYVGLKHMCFAPTSTASQSVHDTCSTRCVHEFGNGAGGKHCAVRPTQAAHPLHAHATMRCARGVSNAKKRNGVTAVMHPTCKARTTKLWGRPIARSWWRSPPGRAAECRLAPPHGRAHRQGASRGMPVVCCHACNACTRVQ